MTAATITGLQAPFWRPSAPAAPPLRVARGLCSHRRLAAAVVATICAFTLLLAAAPAATGLNLFGAETGVAAQTDLTATGVGAETPVKLMFETGES